MKYIVLHCALVVVAACGNAGDRGVAGTRKHVVAFAQFFFKIYDGRNKIPAVLRTKDEFA